MKNLKKTNNSPLDAYLKGSQDEYHKGVYTRVQGYMKKEFLKVFLNKLGIKNSRVEWK